MPELDAIILGHGLAGATLAWHLRWRGWKVLVIDRDEPATSSKVAAGIVTPISGRRVARSWRVDEFIPVAREFYRRAAAVLGVTHYRELPYVRLLQTADEQRRWEEKRHDAAFRQLLTADQPAPLVNPALFQAPDAGFSMQSAWLDVRAWLAASQQHLIAEGAWLTASVATDAVQPRPDGVTLFVPEPLHARHLIFCQGFEDAHNPWFPWLRWKSAKGEILNLHAPQLTEDRIINCGGWLLPTGGGHFRSGSTYVWDDFTSIPTPAARVELEGRMQRLLRVPFSITGHEAAVRPIINESKAVIGLHPVQRRLGIFNGLGSKGVLHAPWFAAQLAALLVDGTPPEYDVDLCRNH